MELYPTETSHRRAPSKKALWMDAYVAALHRVDPSDALKVADEALALADARWKEAPHVGHWQYRHDFPVGHQFGDGET